MILGNAEITRMQLVQPFNPLAVQPASYDCTLADSWIKNDELMSADQMIIYPSEFILASTAETVKLPLNISAYVEGKSSIGRIGLSIQNAGFVDPGFNGQITLELYNASKRAIFLRSGEFICQLVFHTVGDCTSGYAGHYQNQFGATDSVYNE